MEANALKDEYLDAVRQINEASRKLGSRSHSLAAMFRRKEIVDARTILDSHFQILRSLDSELESHTKIQSSINSVQIAASRLTMLASVRSIYVEAIANYEAEIVRMENSKNFSVSICLSFLALLVAIAGLVLSNDASV